MISRYNYFLYASHDLLELQDIIDHHCDYYNVVDVSITAFRNEFHNFDNFVCLIKFEVNN